MPDREGGAPRRTWRADTDDPHRSRLRALTILFQADVRRRSPRSWLAEIEEDPAARALLHEGEGADEDEEGTSGEGDGRQPEVPSGAARRPEPLDEFSRRLITGVGDHLEDIDALLERFSRRWPVHRMPVLDRNALRLGVYELLHEDTGAAIVIDEAIELVKSLSTDDSHRFVNGVLESIREWSDRGEGDPDGRG